MQTDGKGCDTADRCGCNDGRELAYRRECFSRVRRSSRASVVEHAEQRARTIGLTSVRHGSELLLVNLRIRPEESVLEALETACEGPLLANSQEPGPTGLDSESFAKPPRMLAQEHSAQLGQLGRAAFQHP